MTVPPFYVIDRGHGRCLELGGDGSYAACQALLRELHDAFGATFSVELESGHHPEIDKEKGYWNVRMFDQDFFVMRHRDYGMCFWGPNPPADVAGFMQVAEHFGAREQITAAGRIARWFGLPVQ